MNKKFTYPIVLNAESIHALVLGAGSVGQRKIETLLKQDIKNITVYDSSINEKDFYFYETFKNMTDKTLVYKNENFPLENLLKYNLVFIATGDIEYNSFITSECKSRNIFCNTVTNPNEGDFSLPALIAKEDLLLTISTSGLSPALSRSLKADLENYLDSGYSGLCAFLGRLRSKLLALNLPQKENAEVFRMFVNPPYKEFFLLYFSDNFPQKEKKEEFNTIISALPSSIQEVIKKAV